MNVPAIPSVKSILNARINAVGKPSDLFQSILAEKMSMLAGAGSLKAQNTAQSANGVPYEELISNMLYGNAYASNNTTTNGNTISAWDTLVPGSFASHVAMTSDAKINYKTDYDHIIREASQTYGLPESLIKAVIECESDYNPNCVSHAGAVGLMQLMPGTAEEMGVTDRYDPYQNIMGSTKYLSGMVKNFDGDLVLALSGFNYGGNRVKKLGIPHNSATEEAYSSKIPASVLKYAKKVISKMAQYERSV